MAERTVEMTLPDGRQLILEGVPENVTDAQAQENAFGQLGLGVPETGPQLAGRRARELGAAAVTGPARAVSGLGDLVSFGVDKLKSEGGRATAFEQLMEKYKSLGLTPKINALRDQMAGRPLEGDIPGAIAQGATGGLLFPGGPVINAAAGGASAGVTEGAAQAGLPPEAQAVLGLGAGFGVGGALGTAQRVMAPTVAKSQIRDALKSLTPRQRLMAALEGADPEKMAWQAAPEGTALRTLGEKAAMQSGGSKIQAKLQTQKESPALASDEAVQKTAEKLAGKHVTLTPGSEAESMVSAAAARIGGGVYRSYQALKRRFPWVTEQQYDKYLSMSLEDLIAEMRKGKTPVTPGVAASSAAGSSPAPDDEPQNK